MNGRLDDPVVTVERPVPGGAMLGRAEDGHIVLVDGAIPPERVVVDVRPGSGKVVRGRMTSLVGPPSADRVEPPCPHVADGCGGCDWQHIASIAQPRLKREVVVDALRRIGGIDDPEVGIGRALPHRGFRTTVRLAADDTGRLGFRASRSHRLVPVRSCLVADPRVEAAMVGTRVAPGTEVTVRAGRHSDRAMVVVESAASVRRVPDDATVVDRRDRGAHLVERIGDRDLRVSARSFFQTRSDGAEALVDTVRVLLGGRLGPTTRLADLYCGVGLFGAALGASVFSVVAVEWSASSVRDARHNLTGGVTSVVAADVGRWRPVPADVVIADPSRDGLRHRSVGVIAGTGAAAVVLVSCDAGALGRDAALLRAAGFELERTTLVDMFPHTHHVEAVSLFTR